ncbi:RTA1 like protein-domain-containing protein [Exophiala viscosa]|uniref:RTA1 like protein-domain-containing protein n=1 Tax=Exophiala viscosa TaxID=2486360 RepID=UPI00219ECB8E|nr:RTA1 like protein-domain-containing protein [Exophiala viscosa]
MVHLKPVDGTGIYLWKYLPSLPLASIFLGLFTIMTSLLCWRMIKTRLWFSAVFAAGGLCQIIGYTARIFSYWHTDQIGPYIVQSMFILLAPVLYAASIYMVLGRLTRSVHGERFSVVHPRWITRLFVLGDFLALNVQGNGAGLMAKQKTQKIGQGIVVAGLFVQLMIFGFFIVVAAVFHVRMRRSRAKEPRSSTDIPWRQGLAMLYACSGLIIVRSIFRVVEYIMGTDGYPLTHEWTIYVFDAAPMWTVQVIFFLWFPDKLNKASEGGEDGQMLVGEVSRR